MSELLQGGQHPDNDQLNAFVEHSLPAHEQEQMLAHLATCPACRQIVALAMPPLEEVPVVAPAQVRRSALRLVWVAVPALAALIVLAVFLRRPDTPAHTTTGSPQLAEARPPAPPPAPAAPEPEPAASGAPAAHRHQIPRPATPKQEAAPTDRLMAGPPASGAPGGVMGGILGGIGTGPSSPQAAPAPAINGRASFFQVAHLLPSHLAIVSMASHGNERVAIDANHQLFFSDDNGKQWKAVAVPWKGHAVRVALASAGSAALPLHPLARKLADAPMMNRSASLTASTTSAPLSGTVTDPTGATIQGATVEAIEFGSVAGRATSDSEGKFRIDSLPPGSYRVEAQATGFLKQSSVTEIAPAHPTTVDFTLQVGSAAQTVTVETASSALNTVIIAPATPALAQFEITTDDGQRWVSDDGQVWKPK
jgi:Carboxypeptidase regulatory-like domain/Putative zinc-finger